MSEPKPNTFNLIPENNICKSHGGGTNNRALMQQFVIDKLQRPELEDRYYHACENNITLKRVVNSQNEKIKILTTKILRSYNQNKKDEASASRFSFPGEEIIEDQAIRIDELEKENKHLKDQLLSHNVHFTSVRHCHNTHNHCKHSKGANAMTSFNGGLYKGILKSENLKHCHDDDQMIIDVHIENQNICENDSCPKKLEVRKETDDGAEKYKKKISMLKRKVDEQTNLVESLKQNNEELLNSKSSENESIATQTDLEIHRANDAIIIDSLTQQLAEENILVLELKNQLKSAKLAHNIFDEVEGHLNKLDSIIAQQREIEMSPKKVSSKKDKESIIISQKITRQLEAEKINVQVLESLNSQLNSHILEMQRELDALRIRISSESHQKTKPVELIDKSVGTNNIPISSELTSDRKNSTVSSDSKLLDEKTNGTLEMHKQHDELKSNKEKNTLESLLIDKESWKTLHNNNGTTDKIEMKSPKEVKSDSPEQTGQQVSIDDATYDISNNESLSASEMSDFHQDTYNEYLSDGEIPKGGNLQAAHRKQSKEETSVKEYSTTTETKVEAALQILSTEMEKCKKLIGKTSTPRYKNEQSFLKLSLPKKVTEETPGEATESLNQYDFQQSSESFEGIFTLHIKSVEFTDDVMSYLKGLPYFLTWQFYDQLMEHTPMYTEQVSYFDFCSTYNLNLNRELAIYFMKEKLMIEFYKAIDDSSEMFALCSIELKEMLDKPNEKIPFVLRLIPNGSTMLCGVFNCECTLYYDSKFSNVIQEIKLEKSKPRIDSITPTLMIHSSKECQEQEADAPNKIKKLVNDIITVVVDKKHPISKFIVLTLMWLSLEDDSPILMDENVTQLFVEYSFLGYQGQETESLSIPKPKSGNEKMMINFRKVFKVDKDKFLKNRIQLSAILTNESAPEEQIITFNVVSEPEEDPLGLDNCEDLGRASLSILELVKHSGNIITCEVYPDVYLIANPSQVTGKLAIKIEGLDLMRLCQKEIEFSPEGT